MIPAGREMDELIDRLKHPDHEHNWQLFRYLIGQRFICLVDGETDAESNDAEINQDCHVTLRDHIPCYSTDIACAFELWEEMVKAGLMPTLKTIWIDHGEIGYRMICGDRHGETHEDYTREKAIAGAYLKWRENGE